jgi:hypothetical protein
LEVTIEDLKQDALLPSQLDAVNSGATPEKVETWDGYAAQIAAKANASDVAEALALKANATDLPYALVEPGKWEFSGVPSGVTVSQPFWDKFNNSWELSINGNVPIPSLHDEPENAMSLEWEYEGSTITATRASLPDHLLDRAVNAVAVSAATELTMPAATAGKVRDFLVRLVIPAGAAPQIAYPEGVTFENADGSFPEIAADENAACATLLMFTETRAATTGAGATPACFLVKGEKLTAIAAGGAA